MGLNDFYDHGIVRGIIRYARRSRNWKLYGYGWMFRPLRDLRSWKGEGIIGRVENEADATEIAKLGLPVVDVAGAYTKYGFWRVTNDDFVTGQRAGIYLSSLGFDRFAFCGVSNVHWSADRKDGFITALDKQRSEVPAFERPLSWWEKTENIDGLTTWISSLTRPIAVFACNDTAGLKLTAVCGKIGIAIPESVAIIGVDNEDIICELATPSLSSIMLDCEEIGFEAAALLDELISKESTNSCPFNRADDERNDRLVKPREVVERESTRIFAYPNELVNQAMAIIHKEARYGLKVGDVLARIPASPRNLEIKFQRYVGRSIHDEIIKSRLGYAKMLLCEGSQPLHVIVEESGFGSLQRFHEIFRKIEGCTPNEFRKMHMNRNA